MSIFESVATGWGGIKHISLFGFETQNTKDLALLEKETTRGDRGLGSFQYKVAKTFTFR